MPIGPVGPGGPSAPVQLVSAAKLSARRLVLFRKFDMRDRPFPRSEIGLTVGALAAVMRGVQCGLRASRKGGAATRFAGSDVSTWRTACAEAQNQRRRDRALGRRHRPRDNGASAARAGTLAL